jgi:hypothetical protein
MWQRFFLAFLMALFLLVGAGVAWAQGRDDLQDQGQKQRLDLSVDLSTDRYNSQSKNKKAVMVMDIKENTESGSPKAKSFGASSRQHEVSNDQTQGPQVGALGSGLFGKGYNESSSIGSKSFLDGYLLKSVHDDGISSKNIRNKEKPKDDLLQKR